MRAEGAHSGDHFLIWVNPVEPRFRERVQRQGKSQGKSVLVDLQKVDGVIELQDRDPEELEHLDQEAEHQAVPGVIAKPSLGEQLLQVLLLYVTIREERFLEHFTHPVLRGKDRVEQPGQHLVVQGTTLGGPQLGSAPQAEEHHAEFLNLFRVQVDSAEELGEVLRGQEPCLALFSACCQETLQSPDHAVAESSHAEEGVVIGAG